MTKRTTTAAYLAGVTTLAVSLPVMAETRNFDLEGFDEVVVGRGIDVDLTEGEAFSVTAEADRRHMLKRLKITKEGSRLVISRKKSWRDMSLLSRRFEASVDVTLPVLRRLDASSGADVDIDGGFSGPMKIIASSGAAVQMDGASPDTLGVIASSGSSVEMENVQAGQVEIDASSGSTVEIAGACDSLDAEASSGSDIDAGAFECKTGDLATSSGARVDAHASEAVTADASSGSRIEVAGSPTDIERDTKSGGRIKVN